MNEAASGGRLTGESLALLKGLAGNKAALLTMDLMSEESKLRYRSFYPCGDMLVGLRYHEPNPDRKGFKMGRSLKIVDNKIVAEARSDKDILAAMEEGLRAGVLGAVVGEIDRIDLTASRRLQLASEKTATMTLVLRRPQNRTGAQAPITAASRWRVGPASSDRPQDFHQLPERALWRLELSRSRFGAHGSWIVEAPDAQGHLHLPSLLGDRSAHAPYAARVA